MNITTWAFGMFVGFMLGLLVCAEARGHEPFEPYQPFPEVPALTQAERLLPRSDWETQSLSYPVNDLHAIWLLSQPWEVITRVPTYRKHPVPE